MTQFPLVLSTTLDAMKAYGSQLSRGDGCTILHSPQAQGHKWGDALIVDCDRDVNDIEHWHDAYRGRFEDRRPVFSLCQQPDRGLWTSFEVPGKRQFLVDHWIALASTAAVPAHELDAAVTIAPMVTDEDWHDLDVLDDAP